MKYLLLTACVVFALPVAVHVQSSENAYIGVYAEYDHSSWCVDGEIPYEINVWIWILTPDEGMNWFGYNLNVPGTFMKTSSEYHPEMIPEIVMPGDTDPHWAYSGALSMCKGTTWMWTYHLVFSIPDSAPGIIEVTSHPELGESRISDCSNERHPLIKLSNLYVNYPLSSSECLTIATETTSWGAIKGLFDR